MRRAFPALFVALVAVSAANAYYVYGLLSEGQQLTGLSEETPYGLLISMYIYFAGLSAGSVMTHSALRLLGQRDPTFDRISTVVALIFMSFAGLSIALDLGRPWLFPHVFFVLNPLSPINWVAVIYAIYVSLLIVRLLCRPVCADKLLPLNFSFAVAGHTCLALIFAFIRARAFWHTALLPILFLESALLSAAALLALLAATVPHVAGSDWRNDALMVTLGKVMLFSIVAELFSITVESLVILYGGEPDTVASLMFLLAGPLAPLFWRVQVAAGLIAPALILAYSKTAESPPAVVASSILITIGVLAIRYNTLIAGLPPGVPFTRYSPTQHEIAVSATLFLLAMLLLYLIAAVCPRFMGLRGE